MARGIVYVITNDAFPGKVNIGHVKAKPDDPRALGALERRLKQHSSSSVPEPYKLHYAVGVDDAWEAERLLHRAFGFVRPNRREFFDVDADEVEAAMRLTLIGGSDLNAVEPQRVVASVKKDKVPAPLIPASDRSAQEKKKMAPTTKQLGRLWLLKHYPNEANGRFHPSKFYKKPNSWWFTFSCDFFRKRGFLNMLLQKRDNPADFYFLRVPFTFFRDRQKDLDIRRNAPKFDLELSADGNRWLLDKRKGKVSFAQFVQGE